LAYFNSDISSYQACFFEQNKKYKPLDMRLKKTHQIRKALTRHERKIKSAKQLRKMRLHPKRRYAIKA
jgi:large subunit ribosomal protein L35e